MSPVRDVLFTGATTLGGAALTAVIWYIVHTATGQDQ